MSDLTYAQAVALMTAIGTSDWYFALCTASPGKAGSLANELTGHAYARADAAGKLSGITTEGVVVLISPLAFPDPTGSAGTATHIALVDTSSGAADMRAFKALPAPYVWENGAAPLTFPAGGLSFGMR